MKSFFARFASISNDNKRFIGTVACIVVALAAGLLGPVPGTEGDQITVGFVVAGFGGACLILFVQVVVSLLRRPQKQMYFR